MKRGTPRHPKIYALLRELGLPVRSRPVAIGYLEMLWHFTAEFAPQGDIGKYSDEWIEAALDWTGKRGRLIEALTTSGWCEKSDRYRLIVHDWHDHADGAVAKRLTRLGLSFVSGKGKVTGQGEPSRTKMSAANPPALPVPVPVPVPVPKVATVTAPTSREDLIAATAQRMYDRHPKKWGLPLVAGVLADAVKDEPDPTEKLADIEEVHQQWAECNNWTKEDGRWAPKLPEWITDRGFTKRRRTREPTAPKIDQAVIDAAFARYDPLGLKAKLDATADPSRS